MALTCLHVRSLARFGAIIALGLAFFILALQQPAAAQPEVEEMFSTTCVDIQDPQDIPLPGVIDFDALNHGDLVGTYYQASDGVRFIDSSQSTVLAYNYNTPPYISLPNFAYNQPVWPNNSASLPVEISFDHPLSHVGMWIGGGDGSPMTAELIAYDSQGIEICRVSRTPVPGTLTSFIGLNDPVGSIARVLLDYGKSVKEEIIDDLYYAPVYLPPPPNLCPVAFTGYPAAVQAGNPIVVSWQVQDFGYASTQTFLAYDGKSHPADGLYAFAQAPSPNTGIGSYQTAIPTSAPGMIYIRPAVRYSLAPKGTLYTCQGPDEIAVTVNPAPPPVTNPGSVGGTVTDRSGAALQSVPITLCGPGGCTSTSSGTKGAYAFTDQPPGSYQIRASLKNYTPYTSTLTVRSELQSLINIVMRHTPPPQPPPPTGTVTGVVRDRNTLQPLENATVALSPNYGNTSGEYRNAVTDATGTFTFSNLPVGDYQAFGTRAQYRLWFQLYTVTNGGTATGDILMTPSMTLPPTQDPNSPIDLTVAHVMPVQTTQRWTNVMPLVARKTTFVRVFLDSGGGFTASMPRVTGWITSAGCLPGPLYASAIPVPNVNWSASNSLRSKVIQNPDNALNFELPIECTAAGTRQFTVEIRAPYNYPERSLANNRMTFNITFQNRRPMIIHMVRASLRNFPLCPGTVRWAPSRADSILSFDFMKRVYPAVIYLVDEGMEDFCMSPRWDSDLAGFWWINLNMGLRFSPYAGISAPGIPLPVPVHMGYALVDEHECDGGTCNCGQTITTLGFNWVASGLTGVHNCQTTAAHEMGHARGLDHSGNWHDENSGGGFWPWPYIHGALSVFGPDESWGYDSPNGNPNYEVHAIWSPVDALMDPTTPPEHQHDFMAYDWPRWLSDLSWQHLFDDLIGSGPYGSPTGQVDTPQNITPTRYLMVGGYQDDAGEIQIGAMRPYTDTTGNLAVGVSMDASGPVTYTLNLVNVYGQVLSSKDFVLEANGDKEANFMTVLPYPPGVSAVEVITGTQTVTSQLYSNLAPVVNVNDLDGSQVYSGIINLTWSATDPDGEPMTYDVAYSPDGGDTWITKLTSLQDNSASLDTTYLAGSDSALFRVIASDGLNTGSDETDAPVRVVRHAPEVTIDSLIENQVYGYEEVLLLQGTYSDREDMPPFDDLLFVWSSDLDGEIGRGQNTSVIGLTAGRHTITLTATDRDGMTGIGSVVIWVGEQIFLPIVKR